MKYYNFKKAKEIIKKYHDLLDTAELGMYEDWFWTASDIYVNGQFLIDLPDNADEMEAKLIEAYNNGLTRFTKDEELTINPEFKRLTQHHINGLYGSRWATPSIMLFFKDGSKKMIACHNNGSSEKNNHNILGCLSGPAQNSLPPLTIEE